MSKSGVTEQLSDDDEVGAAADEGGGAGVSKDVGGGLVVQVQEAGWPVRAYRGWLFGTLVEQLLRARRIDPRTISDLSFAADIPGRRPAEQGRSVRFADPASVSVPQRAAPVDEVRQGCHFTFSDTSPSGFIRLATTLQDIEPSWRCSDRADPERMLSSRETAAACRRLGCGLPCWVRNCTTRAVVGGGENPLVFAGEPRGGGWRLTDRTAAATRSGRVDRGVRRRMPRGMVELVEGWALRRPQRPRSGAVYQGPTATRPDSAAVTIGIKRPSCTAAHPCPAGPRCT